MNGNVVCLSLLSSNNTPCGIGGIDNAEGNYRLGSTLVLSNGNEIELEDGGSNGTAYGARTLKRKNTYIGFGYDFDNTWSIVEGANYPYNKAQSIPPTVTDIKLGENAEISGTASGDGKCYLFVDDVMYEGVVSNGEWKMSIGYISEDALVRVSVETGNKKPSIMITVNEGNDEGTDAEDDKIELSAAGVSTYSSLYDLDFTNISGLKAYIISGFNPLNGELILTQVFHVPARTGLYLTGDAGTYHVPHSNTNMYYSNLLVGVPEAITVSPTDGIYTNYILANGSFGINFYTLSKSGEIAAGKAYLSLPTDVLNTMSAPCFMFTIDSEMDRIADIYQKESFSKNGYYDLMGRSVANPTKGLYIKNGKKILVK